MTSNQPPQNQNPQSIERRPSRSVEDIPQSQFLSHLGRYRVLLWRRGWIILLGLAIGLAIQAYRISQRPPVYRSGARLVLSGTINIPEGAVYNEQALNFFGTQIEIIKGSTVRKRAEDRVTSLRPDLHPSPVALDVGLAAQSSIFALTATGGEPLYTQAFLDALVSEYIAYRQETRTQKSDVTLTAITEQLAKLDKELEAQEEELRNFQKENNVVVLEEGGNSAATYLARLNEQLAQLKTQINLLDQLNETQSLQLNQQGQPAPQDPAAATQRREALGSIINQFGPEADLTEAENQLKMLQATKSDLSRYLRPKHPKMVALEDQVVRQTRLIDLFRDESLKKLSTRRQTIELQIKSLEEQIKLWEGKALDASQRLGQHERIKSKVERTKSLYEKLMANLSKVDVNRNIDQDIISVLENASPAFPSKPDMPKDLAIGAVAGLLLGLGVLFLLDRVDDRLSSISEFQLYFRETILGQVPLEAVTGSARLGLLEPNDKRHVFAESMRNIRSSIHFMPWDGPPPKVILLTSSVPGEGKSTIVSNLAITLAFAGARTLLIDADLRRGVTHDLFKLPKGPGLSEILKEEVHWSKVVTPTAITNLSVIQRGHLLSHPSEHLLGSITARFLQEVQQQYDYIIIDSSPMLATDDTATLAPIVDTVIFLARLGHTSARMASKSLELLYNRQANVAGVILNCVDARSRDYYYYNYSEYHDTK